MFDELKSLKKFVVSFVIVMAVTFTACGSMSLSSNDDLQLIKEKSFNISSGKNLLVDISSGDVKVTYWDKAEVYIKVFGNENAMEKMNFTMEATDEMVKVTGKKKSSISSWFSNVNVEIEIKVPAKFNLDIKYCWW